MQPWLQSPLKSLADKTNQESETLLQSEGKWYRKMVKIFNINEKMSLLEQVINLGDTNKATLGFLPRGAFDSKANDGRILVAVDKNDNLLGYLLYGIKQSANLVYIVHLCVNQSERRQGIAKALFNELKETTKYPFSGIKVHCRRDYEVNELWPRLGFFAVGEKDGRSKKGSKLTISKAPDLFLPSAFSVSTIWE